MGQLDAGQVLHEFLQTLGVPPAAIPAALDARTSLYRGRLAGRRLLIVLDNARSAEQIRPLLPGSPGCAVIVTSRDRLESVVVRDGAGRVVLDVLSPAGPGSCWSAGSVRIGRRGAGIGRELAELCARLPLALAVAAARAAAGSWTVEAFVARLRERGLDALRSPEADLDVRTLFRASVDQLPEAASRLFRLLALHPGPRFDRYSCAALLGGSVTSAGTLLEILADAHLVTEYAEGRYGMHDLLHAVARGYWTDGCGQRDALARLLGYYLSTAERAATTIRPGRPDELPPPGPPWPSPPIGRYEEAMGSAHRRVPGSAVAGPAGERMLSVRPLRAVKPTGG